MYEHWTCYMNGNVKETRTLFTHTTNSAIGKSTIKKKKKNSHKNIGKQTTKQKFNTVFPLFFIFNTLFHSAWMLHCWINTIRCKMWVDFILAVANEWTNKMNQLQQTQTEYYIQKRQQHNSTQKKKGNT